MTATDMTATPIADQATTVDAATPERSLGEALCAAFEGPLHERRQRTRADFPAEGMHRDPALPMAEARAWTLARLHTVVESGFGRSGVSEEHGGLGDMIQSVIDFEVMAHGDLSALIKSGVQHGLFGGAILGLGTPDQHARFLADALELRMLGCFAMTEVGHGSDVASLETTITFDADTDELIVHSPTPSATKTYIGNAAEDGHAAVVFGQLIVAGQPHGIHCVLVPIRDANGSALPGVTLGDNGPKGGLLGLDNGTISFDRVRVPRDHLLSRYGGVTAEGAYESSIQSANRRFFTMLGSLVRGRVCIGVGAAIAARRALSIAVRYAEERRQFHQPGADGEVALLDYQSHQRKLLPAVATAYALGFAHNELTSQFAEAWEDHDNARAHRELETFAAGLKVMSTRFANDTIQVCREACGGAGYMAANQLTTLRADADVFVTFEGDNTVLLQLVAKGILTNYREVWGGLDRIGMVQASARLVGSAVIERTGAGLLAERLAAAASGRGDAAYYDRGWHAWMFEERERHTIDSLAGRMRAARKDSFQDANKLQDHVLFAARAHLDRVILDAFIDGVDACQDPAAKHVLEQLCTLYALTNLEQDAAWFMEHNRMSPARSKALRGHINQLCAELRPVAIELVDGLGVPKEWLGAEMLIE